jgi:hypothetical protein
MDRKAQGLSQGVRRRITYTYTDGVLCSWAALGPFTRLVQMQIPAGRAQALPHGSPPAKMTVSYRFITFSVGDDIGTRVS